jgi:NADPH:quinone reductase-like Zn-dependent oxidoreductase
VDKLHVQGMDSVFIAGGAGGVGSFAIQIARHFGVQRIITTASGPNHDYVRLLGASDVVDYHTEDVVSQVMALTGGQGVPAAVDTVGGDNDIITASVLGYEGQMVELVQMVRPDAYPDAFMKGLSFHQLSLGSGHRYGQRARDALVEAGRQVSALLASGYIRPPRLATVRIDGVGDALKKMREQGTVGKIVMTFLA